MEMRKVNSGRLRAIGYESRDRLLRIELEGGSVLEYSGVPEETWRRLSTSGSAWSYYRDNIEEEFSSRKVSGKPSSGGNPLDDIFR